MPLKFTPKIARRARFDLSPWSPTDFFKIATQVSTSITERIGKALDVNDAPAPPLKTERYKRAKERRGIDPVRNWKWSSHGGALLKDIRVTSASSIRAVISANSPQNIIKLRANQKRHRQFGMSPNNRRVFLEAARAVPFVRVRTSS